ncbi:cupin [Novosphingobium sp.]|uniref:cupin n=1 Tax=Novosphingobium sp. TaxID=1874826 RepID=UPI003BAC505E
MAHRLDRQPIHIGPGARAVPQPPFTGMDWYGDYIARHGADGAEGRLVSQHSFTESWDSWEMHPAGDEVVLMLSGEGVLHQEFADGSAAEVRLVAGEYAVNPPGAWHTMDLVSAEATALFITAGLGTEHRPR